MASALTILLLGCWLPGRSGVLGQRLYLKPSISISPRGVIPVGGNVTIWCWHDHFGGMRFLLYKDGVGNYLSYTDPAGPEAKFPILSVRREQRGNYTCRYSDRTGNVTYSEHSDPVQIIVAEPSLPKPSISISPSRGVSLGEAVTIRCGAGPQNATFLLYKDRDYWGRAMPRGDVAEFPVASVTEEDVGSYSCSYLTRRELVALSYPSDPAWLAVRDYTWGNVARLAVGTGVLLVLALILAEAARGWRRGGC